MKLKKSIKIILLIIVLVSVGYFSAMYFSRLSGGQAQQPASQQIETAIISNEATQGKVLGDTGAQTPSAKFGSDSFRSPQITIGGEAIAIPSGEQSIAPEITDLESEILTTKTDQQVKFLLSWKTNKACVSSVGYSKEGGAAGKTVSEDSYGYIHSAEIAPLNFSTSYKYTITIKDKWGNSAQSEKLAFYTGAPNVSIFDLLGGAFKDMFDWAGKK